MKAPLGILNVEDSRTGCLEVDEVMFEGHFTPNLVHHLQKSFCFQEKSIKNPYESFCSEKISYAFPISELPLGHVRERSFIVRTPKNTC